MFFAYSHGNNVNECNVWIAEIFSASPFFLHTVRLFVNISENLLLVLHAFTFSKIKWKWMAFSLDCFFHFWFWQARWSNREYIKEEHRSFQHCKHRFAYCFQHYSNVSVGNSNEHLQISVFILLNIHFCIFNIHW